MINHSVINWIKIFTRNFKSRAVSLLIPGGGGIERTDLIINYFINIWTVVISYWYFNPDILLLFILI